MSALQVPKADGSAPQVATSTTQQTAGIIYRDVSPGWVQIIAGGGGAARTIKQGAQLSITFKGVGR